MKIMQAKFNDYKTTVAALDYATDIQNNIDNLISWNVQWMSYVKNGGDRPPSNPTHP